jgi:hypothetical protein
MEPTATKCQSLGQFAIRVLVGGWRARRGLRVV